MRSSVNTDIAYQFTGQEYDTELSLHNFRARMYDSDLGMFYAMDPAGQGFSPYGFCGNNPIIYVDKDGRFWHIVIGAVIGGVINTVAHWDEIQQNPWNALTAFSIGAAGGAVAAATGGAALAAAGGTIVAGAGGFVAGSLSAGMAYLAGSMVTNVGNSIAFNDPYPSFEDQAWGLGFSMLTGGLINGALARSNGLSFWNGTAPLPSVPSMPAISSITSNTNSVVKPAQMPKANIGGVLDDGLPQQGQGSIRLLPKTEVPAVQNYSLNPEWKNWSSYMLKRGWSYNDIQRTLTLGQSTPHVGTNWLNPGNPMTIVTNPITGKSLIIDKITKEIIQLGNVGFKY